MEERNQTCHVWKQAYAKNLWRRNFLRLITSLAGLAIATPVLGQANSGRTTVHPPAPAEPPGGPQLGAAPLGNHRLANREALREQEKEFRDCLERLFESTRDLREEMQGLQFKELFSVRVWKETEAMERLAKRLKQLAKA